MRQSTLAFGQKPAGEVGRVVEPTSTSTTNATRKGNVKSTKRAHESVVQPSSSSSSSSSQQAHPFFAKRNEATTKQYTKNIDSEGPPTKRVTTNETSISSRKHRLLQKDAPWPAKGESHVQPFDETCKVANSHVPLEKRQDVKKKVVEEQEKIEWPWRDFNDPAEARVTKGMNGIHAPDSDMVSYVPADDDAALSFARSMASSGDKDDRSRLWTDKFRPQQCDQVLGNDKQARYLRDWLKALQVTNVSSHEGSTKVVKRVQKKRARVEREMDDFLVGDTEEEEAWFDQFRATNTQSSSTITAQEEEEEELGELDFSRAGRLTNVIVLVGPSGCGKTASVYACASELGYEVFELFAGMGKRGGRDVVSLVGDLCRNHMVSSGGTGGGAFTKLKTIDPKGAQKARQSLILFEEVDILYEEDKGFWPALVELAAESRRPMILTCNDLATLPLDDLPIQRVLHFSPPSPEIAVPYLQLLIASNASISAVYADQTWTRLRARHDEAVGCSSSSHHHDLRQALMQLQFAVFTEEKSKEAKSAATLRGMIALAERSSVADIVGRKTYSRSIEQWEPDQYSANGDDVLLVSVRGLYKARPRGDETCLAEFGREEEIYDALSGEEEEDVDARRSQFVRVIDALCDAQSVPVYSRTLSDETIVDYATWIHKMVQIDDAEEAAHRAQMTSLLDEVRREANGERSEPTLASAAASLRRIGIRPSRHSSRLLLQRDSDGVMQLGRREPDFCRWLAFDRSLLDQSHMLHFDLDDSSY